MAPPSDELDEAEVSRFDTGRRQGIAQVLDHPALTALALELELSRAAIRALTAELQKRDRTIRAYQTIIRGDA